ncbi:MAG TPA: tetratricopeptide repeat protein [Bacteroidales bacterium]|nr:tetratricopeptide repeat protein [Bacteroidales bacterium]
MKSLLFLLLLTIQMALSAVPVTDSLFVKGNEYYMQKQYAMAEQCYSRVIQLGFESADLYFNLGNALYKQEKLAAAILYYEKALILKPGDQDIKENLALANARIIDKIDAIPEFFVKRWINGLKSMFSPDTWAIICLVLFVLGLAGFLMYYISSSYGFKRAAFTIGVVFIILLGISVTLMITRIRTIINKESAIIMSTSVTARSSPDEQSTNVFVLHEGTKVSITDSILNWKEIRIPNGNTGWVPEESLEEI